MGVLYDSEPMTEFVFLGNQLPRDFADLLLHFVPKKHSPLVTCEMNLQRRN